LWGKVTSLTAGKLTVRTAQDAALVLPWKAVTRMTVHSDRLAFLSDMDPAAVKERPVVTLPRSYRRDRSVAGKTLTLKGRSFDKGIGTHARCELAYDVQKKFDVLAAVIGIDDETNGRGDCVFVVLGDGKELFRARMKGTDEPRDVKVDISGVERITLIVEPGEDLDLADHADWCDARLLKVDSG